MMEDDPLDRLLGEWRAPEPSREMDARVMAAYRSRRTSGWRWARAPVAAVLLIAASLLIGFRGGEPPATPTHGYITRIDARGFEPLPNGAARVVRREAVLP